MSSEQDASSHDHKHFGYIVGEEITIGKLTGVVDGFRLMQSGTPAQDTGEEGRALGAEWESAVALVESISNRKPLIAIAEQQLRTALGDTDTHRDCPSKKLEPRNVHHVSDCLAKRFESVMAPNHDRKNAHDLIDEIAKGYDIWIVGGAVRDILRGEPAERVTDLDMSTTAPPPACRDLAQEFFPRGQGYTVTDTEHGIVHITDPAAFERGVRAEPFAQIGSLKRYYQRRESSWYFGTALEDDVAHRDLTINALFYDPIAKAVVDPSGKGLEDLGVTGDALTADTYKPPKVAPKLRIPEMPTWMIAEHRFVLQQIVRLVKALEKYSDANVENLGGWLTNNAQTLQYWFPAEQGAESDRRKRELRAALSTLARSNLGRTLAGLAEDVLELHQTSWIERLEVDSWDDQQMADHVRTLLSHLVRRLAHVAVAAGEDIPDLAGHGLRTVVPRHAKPTRFASDLDPVVIAEPLCPPEPTPAMLMSTVEDLLRGGYRSLPIRAWVDGGVHWVRGLVSDAGPTYVETDAHLMPLLANGE